MKSKIMKGLTQAPGTAAWLFLCITGGYLLALIAADTTVFNADSAAPYYQAKLISSGITINPKELSFARIPSIFPDLVTLVTLAKGDQLATFHSIFSRYAWIIASFLIFLQAEFSRLALARSINRLQAALISISTTVCLAIYNVQFRETIGLILTPLHHGGNVINTLAFGCILLWKPNHTDNSGRTGSATKPIALAAITAIGVASNKLFIFTALLPALLASILISLELKRRNKLTFLRILICKKNRKQLLLISASACAGIAIAKLLNTQCSLPIIVRPLKTYSQFLGLATGNYFYTTGAILAILIAAYSLYLIRKEQQESPQIKLERAEKERKISLGLGCLYLCLSTVSPLTYIWLLGEPESLPIRYTLIFGTGICASFVVFFCILSNTIFGQGKMSAFLKILACTSIATALTFEGIKLINKSFNMEDRFSKSFASRHKNARRTIAVLHQLGLTHGLSDFWGTELALISDLDYPNRKRIEVEPILADGTPDLWAHSKYQFMNKRGNPKKYDFVITTNVGFEKSIIDSYGQPVTTKDLPGENGKLLIYKDWAKKQKIKEKIQAKLSEFERQCNRRKINFAER